MRRRAALVAAPTLLGGCMREDEAPIQGGWAGTGAARGHRLRDAVAWPAAGAPRRVSVLVAGAGIAGLASARAFMRRGIDDVHVLDLEDQPGGNARGHRLGGMACPIGAHYLPLPPASAHEVREWLFELGLLTMRAGREVADERHLCHSPQERLWFDGAWHEGLLPPHEGSPATLTAYRRFAAALRRARAGAAFALPAHRSVKVDARAGQRRSGPGPGPAAFDGQTFGVWLAQEGLDDARLLWYLDYCCRDDFGAGIDTVSAWAGLHYFASRHGFRAPGDEEGELDAVFTWPEGNAWLVSALARPLGGARLHTGRTVLRVREERHAVQVLAWNEATQVTELWTAGTVVLALPLFVAARMVESPPAALTESARVLRYAPWLVANLRLDAPLLERPGVPSAWDSVVYGGSGLGYVDAMHQSLRAHAGATVLTAYHALPEARRSELLRAGWQHWAQFVLDDLHAVHPDLRRRVREIVLTRHGHAMAIPVPGVRTSATTGGLGALRTMRGRLRFVHADLAGYSVFEESFTAGCEVAA